MAISPTAAKNSMPQHDLWIVDGELRMRNGSLTGIGAGFQSGQTLIVDWQGKAGFKTLELALQYAVDNDPPEDPAGVLKGTGFEHPGQPGQNPSWFVAMMPGKYLENAPTIIPPFVKVFGIPPFDARSSITSFGNRPHMGVTLHYGQSATSGDMVRVEESGGLANLYVTYDGIVANPPNADPAYDGTPTGDIVVVNFAGTVGPLGAFSHQECSNVAIRAVSNNAAFGMVPLQVISEGQDKGMLIDRCSIGLGGNVALGTSGIGIDILDNTDVNGRPVVIRDSTIFVEAPLTADFGLRSDSFAVSILGDTRIDGFATPFIARGGGSFTTGFPVPTASTDPGYKGQKTEDENFFYFHDGVEWLQEGRTMVAIP